jgi:hypothetical protein
VVIAAATNLPLMRSHAVAEGGEVLAFADTETLRALEAIVSRRPALVTLDRTYVSTARGAALVNRIKLDPMLARTELRVVAADAFATVAAPPPIAASENSADALPVSAIALDANGTRRAPRTEIAARPEILSDGNPATLIDLSPLGAQVLSQAILRPNQRVRILLPEEPASIRVTGTVIWASFEIPANMPPRYRAGLDFTGQQTTALESYCARYGA